MAHEGEAAFYRIWSLREAMAKATGDGVLHGMNGEDAIDNFSKDDGWISDGWNLAYRQPMENASLALAVPSQEDVVSKLVTLGPLAEKIGN